jgi:SAM-dependent methyltransferase
MSPPSQNHVTREELEEPETFYPLQVRVCERCFLVQLPECVCPERIFTEYAYFSSYSDTWLRHARDYTDAMIARFGLGREDLVVELGSNDGYLLQYFKERGVSVLGVEPAANVATAAIRKGIPTEARFFCADVARELTTAGRSADLVVGNNVLAQVPNLNNFVEGIRILLKPRGILTMEFPHLLRLIEDNQFDTIYHEHYSYFSFGTVERLFAVHGIVLFDVEELPTHGGSLRIYGRHVADESKPITDRVAAMHRIELEAEFDRLDGYAGFSRRVSETKRKLLSFLIETKRADRSIAGYGAPGKGNTLLNYCGIRTDFLDYTVDRNPYKQGKFTPGTRIPIHPPERIRETRPDYLLILPWNLKDEIIKQIAYIREWGGQFVVPIPEVQVLP